MAIDLTNLSQTDLLQVVNCPKCGSARRSEYWGKIVQRCAGLRADKAPYASIIRRRCRCLDCGQVRIDKEYS